MSAVTHTGIDFYMNMPIKEFIELNNEVAEQMEQMSK